MKKLEIKNLHVSVGNKEILKGIDLTVRENEVHALMGPNGNGKSTLLATIMGNPNYTVTEGSIFYDGKDVLAMPVNERSIAGLFLAMQYPQEVPGVTNSDFLRAAMNVRREQPVPLFTFIKTMEKTIQDLQMKEDLAHRFLNEGFSGGEKKRNEIVQMEMLRPSLSMLDEVDSGLDVDAMRVVAEVINQLRQESGMSLIIVSQFTHVLIDGKIAIQGDGNLARRIDSEGYDWVYEKYGIIPPENLKSKVKPRSVLGRCAVKEMTVKGEGK